MAYQYDPDLDILSIRVATGDYWKSIELGANVVLDISKDGAVLGFEIFKASHVFRGDAARILKASKESSTS